MAYVERGQRSLDFFEWLYCWWNYLILVYLNTSILECVFWLVLGYNLAMYRLRFLNWICGFICLRPKYWIFRITCVVGSALIVVFVLICDKFWQFVRGLLRIVFWHLQIDANIKQQSIMMVFIQRAKAKYISELLLNLRRGHLIAALI